MEKELEILSEQGFCVVNDFYSQEEIARLKKELSLKEQDSPSFLKNKEVFAIRQLLKEVPTLKKTLFNKRLISLLPQGYFLTKAIYFDKPGNSNWFVSLHQDISISVADKTNVEGYKNWTFKRGQYGVEPPQEILENIITVRVHLDDTDMYNGALSVIPGSHQKGVQRIEALDDRSTVHCEVRAGGVMLMKPLTFHTSKRSTENKRRRVIHLEFSNRELSAPVTWLEKEKIISGQLE